MSSIHRGVIDGRLGSEWQPREFGFRRAVLLACLPVAAGVMAAVLLFDWPTVSPPTPPTTVRLVESSPLPPAEAAALPALPALSPPSKPDLLEPPPESQVAPPQESVAVAITPDLLPRNLPDEPAPVRADDMAATIPLPPEPVLPSVPRDKPPPVPPYPPARSRPVRQVRPAAPSPRDEAAVLEAAPPQEAAARATSVPRSDPPLAAPDTTSGLGAYRAGLHAQIERNMMADEEIRRLGVTGVAYIEAVIGPDGGVLSAAVARSSGNRPIDRAALAAVRRGGYRPFGPHMPVGPITIGIPITITAD